MPSPLELLVVLALLGADPPITAAEPFPLAPLPPFAGHTDSVDEEVKAPAEYTPHLVGHRYPPGIDFEMYYNYYDPWRVPPPRCAPNAPCCNWCKAPGDMVFHPPYCPVRHGYYYYRPYNVTRVETQQAFVTRWGEDPRHPYANEVFRRVYEELNIRNGEDVEAPEADPPLPPPAPPAPILPPPLP